MAVQIDNFFYTVVAFISVTRKSCVCKDIKKTGGVPSVLISPLASPRMLMAAAARIDKHPPRYKGIDCKCNGEFFDEIILGRFKKGSPL